MHCWSQMLVDHTLDIIYRVTFKRNFSKQQNLRRRLRMDNTVTLKAFFKGWGHPPCGTFWNLGLLECISCILECEWGYLNRTLISLLNFGFVIQREYIEYSIFFKIHLMTRHILGFQTMLKEHDKAPLKLLWILHVYSCVQCISFVVTETYRSFTFLQCMCDEPQPRWNAWHREKKKTFFIFSYVYYTYLHVYILMISPFDNSHLISFYWYLVDFYAF